MRSLNFNFLSLRRIVVSRIALLALLVASGSLHATEKLIIDTDMGPDVDDVGAIAVAHYYADQGRAELLAVMVSNQGGDAEWAVPAADAVNTYYNRPDVALATNRGPATAYGGDGSQFTKAIGSNSARYGHDQVRPSESEDAVTAYRRILSAQPDKSVNLLVVGWLSNIANLMDSGAHHKGDAIAKTGKQLLEQKLKRLIVMGGQYPSGIEFNFKFDGPSAAKVTAELDVPMVFSGLNLGNKVQTGDSLIYTPVDNPVREAYRLYGRGEPYNRSSWDLTVVVYAVEGLSDYFSASATGKNHVYNDGSNVWREANNDRDIYLKLKDSGAAARLRARLNQILQAIPSNCDLNVILSAENPSCGIDNGSVSSRVSGGRAPYVYRWSTGASSTAIQGLGESEISLTVRDSAGCQVDRRVSLSRLAVDPQVKYAGSVLGGSATAQVSGGRPPFSTLWSTGASGTQASNLAEGDYSVTVRDASGCSVVSYLTVEQKSTHSSAYLEAECAQSIGTQWSARESSAVSAGQYLQVPVATYNFRPSGAPSNILKFQLDLDAEADYALHAHVSASDLGSDSLWYRVNGGDWIDWHLGLTSGFVWKRFALPVSLEAGANTLEVSFREGGLKLDKLFVSRDGSTPIGIADTATNCQ